MARDARLLPASAIDRKLARALIAFMLHSFDGERFGAAVRAMRPGSITAAPHRMAALSRIVDAAAVAFDRTFSSGAPVIGPETRAFVAAELYRRFVWKSGSPAELAQVDPTASRSFAVYAHRRRRKRPAVAKPRAQRAKTNLPNLPRLTKAQAVADFQRHVVPEIWVTHGRENLETLGYAWRRYVGNMVRAGRLPPGAVDWTVPVRRRR